MDYAALAVFARSYGLIYLALLFAAVLVYALWPANKARFDRAARIPLTDREPTP